MTLGLASVMYFLLLSLFPETPRVYAPTDPRRQGNKAADTATLRQTV